MTASLPKQESTSKFDTHYVKRSRSPALSPISSTILHLVPINYRHAFQYVRALPDIQQLGVSLSMPRRRLWLRYTGVTTFHIWKVR